MYVSRKPSRRSQGLVTDPKYRRRTKDEPTRFLREQCAVSSPHSRLQAPPICWAAVKKAVAFVLAQRAPWNDHNGSQTTASWRAVLCRDREGPIPLRICIVMWCSTPSGR